LENRSSGYEHVLDCLKLNSGFQISRRRKRLRVIRICSIFGLRLLSGPENQLEDVFFALMANKKPSRSWVFWAYILLQAYKEIELETFCLDSSGLSMQPVKPTIIRAIAKSDKTFFII
jgi:hypothetical protein